MGRLLTLLRKKGGEFSPLDLPGLALWLDASDLSTITHDAGAVSQWDDKSGNARHAVQGTGAAQPTTGTVTVNDRNVLVFNGDYLEIPGAPQLYSNSLGLTILAVATLPPTNALNILSKYTSGDNRREYALGNDAGNATFFVTQDPTSAATRSIAATSPWADYAVVRARWAPGAAARIAINNGTEVVSGTTVATMTPTLSPLEVGRYNASTTGAVNIAELIVVSDFVDGDQLASAEAALGSKWGVTLA